MSILHFPEDTDKALQDWVYKEYARDAGLLRDEFVVLIDPEQKHDVFMGCGSTIQIIVRYPPGHSKFFTVLKSAFGYKYLKQLRRSKALVRKSDAERWYSVEFSNMERALPLLKRNENYVSHCTTRYLTQLAVYDKKSGREVVVTIENGNAFDAQAKAYELLFGERV
jgi:hypothetical protein